VVGTIVINTWNFPEFQANTKNESVLAGCTGQQLVSEAAKRRLVDASYEALLQGWLRNPRDESWVTAEWK